MKIKVLYIKPLDTLAFRKSKTFSTSEESVFPNAKTFYGAIFAAFFRNKKVDINRIELFIKNKELSIIGPFLSDDTGEIFFRMPSIIKMNDETEEYYKAYIDKTFSFNIEEKKLYGIRYKKMRNLKEPAKKYVSLKELEKIKYGYLNISDTKESNDQRIYKEEIKIGIALKNRKAVERMLYLQSYYRFIENAGFAFFVEYDNLGILNEVDVIKLGSKGKLARLELKEIETTIFEKINDKEKGILLLTPAFFDRGVLPKHCDNIIAIANYKPESIGFWDLKNNKPGEMFKVVPAGSVYYIEGDLSNEYTENFTDKFQEFNFGKYIEIEL